MQPLEGYKAFIRQHPLLVQSIERLLQLFAWSPQRFSSSELAYETYSAAIGLLSLWHESIIQEDQTSSASKWQTCLTAVELVQTLVEIRGIELEKRGKLSRYGPLAVLELIKAWLRLKIWSTTSAQLALVPCDIEDHQQLYSWQQQDALHAAFQRMRQRYGCSACSSSISGDYSSSSSSSSSRRAGNAPCHQEQQQGQQQEQQPATEEFPGLLQDKLSALYRPSSAASLQSACCSPECCSNSSASPQAASAAAAAAQQSRNWLPGYSWLTSSISSSRQDSRRPQNHQQAIIVGKQQQHPQTCQHPQQCPQQQHQQQQYQQHQQLSLEQQAAKHQLADRNLAQRMLVTGEVLHIMRPVVYIFMLKRYGRRSWKPWGVSLLLDLASSSLHARARALLQASSLQQQQQGAVPLHHPYAHLLHPANQSSLLSLALLQAAARSRGQLLPSEQHELAARKVQLLRYLLRSPCFDSFTKHLLQRLTRSISWLPGAAQLGEFVLQLVEGMQQYYSYVEA